MRIDDTRIDSQIYVKCLPTLLTKVLAGCITTLYFLSQSATARADVEVFHTYSNSLGQEVANVIAVDKSKLLALLPPGYNLVPAAALGLGDPNQGIVVIANFRGFDRVVDNEQPLTQNQVAIDVAILVAEPSDAVQAGVNIPGAIHLYALAIYTNDARYAASLRRADIPVEFVQTISYQRNIDDATGAGDLTVNVPSKDSPFHTFSSSLDYVPMPGAFNAVFWHDGRQGRAVLHFLDQPFRQGTAISQIYMRPSSTWDKLFDGGGLGPCPPHPETGYKCVIAPALNLRYDKGTVGKLQLIK